MKSITQLGQVDASPAQPLAVDAKALAKMLGVGLRTVWRLHAAESLPTPVKIRGCVRWRTAEIESWLAAGCPSREAWEAVKQRGN